MAEARTGDGYRLCRRRWSFADCVFDEANWTLIVGGQRVAVETKPLELLRALLLNAGRLVSKDELLDAVWPDVVVVEASLATAVRKLRTALNDDARATPLIETVPRLGYRLAGPVAVEELAGGPNGAMVTPAQVVASDVREAARSTAGRRGLGMRRLLAISGGLAIVVGGTAMTLASSGEVAAPKAVPAFSQQEAMSAIRRLDIAAVERMLAAGWDPNAEMRGEGNRALHYAVEMCEWNPGHDRGRLVLLVRTLQEGGGRLEQRNVWGDTPYSIAKSPRYCGPGHPVTRSIRATCTEHGVVQDRCLASYEIARRNRR
jgi:DNA-binding winged helix-turn-helix (wHTH) protein